MLQPYAKPHLSFANQVLLLKCRGLGITNEWQAARHLERIGYYRLKDYWHPLRQSRPVIRPDGSRFTEILEEFRPDTTFEHALGLYVFDKKLRLLMLDGIERIEVALRVDVAHILGQRDAFAHRNNNYLDPKRSIAPTPPTTRHVQWLKRADEAERRSRADWLKDFRLKYSAPLPIWMAVETWELGTLSNLIEMSHLSDRFKISKKYGISDPELLTSWIKVLSYVRNVCAHHARLWNHPLINQPKLPKQGAIPFLDHLAAYNLSHSRVYGAASVVQHFLRVINPNSAWKDRMKNHWNDFPVIPAVKASQAGFMPSWNTQPLWN
jgi:abortive infection bacteriophage resistance protein